MSATRVRALRSAFDDSFARQPPEENAVAERLLDIAVGSDRYLVRLGEVSGLFVDKKVTRLPGAMPDLLGIAGFRGTALPIYDLAKVMGAASASAPRWLVVAAFAPVGLAFQAFEGYVTAGFDRLVAADAGDRTRDRRVREILNEGTRRPVLHLPSVIETIRNG